MGISSKFKIATDIERMKPRFQKELNRLQGKPGALKDLYIPRVFPRNDGGFSIGYDLIVENQDKGEEKIVLWGHLPGPDQTLPGNAVASQQEFIIFDDISLIVPIFPYDPKLKILRDFVITGKPKKHLARIPALSGKNFRIIECRLLGYRLERRAVLEYTLEIEKEDGFETAKFVARITRPGKVERTLDIADQLTENGFAGDSSDGLTTPGLLGYDKEHGVTFMELVPGRSLHSLIGDRSFPVSCAEAGRLIRKLHSMAMNNLPGYTADDELDNLRKKVDIIANIFPEAGKAFADACSGISRGRIADGHPTGVVHRDFYDKQTLHSPGRATLLDFDNMASSDPALDFGNFMAHVVLRSHQSPENELLIQNGSEAFVRGYGSVDEDFRERANWWKDAALLRLAALYSLRPRWRSIAKNLILEIKSSQEGKNILSGEKK